MASGLVMEPVPITSQKHDPAWKHCQMFKNGERVQLKCIYCSKLFKGGGIHRIKEHLAGQKGNASTCLLVPPDVRALMQQSLDGVVVKKRNRQKLDEEITNITPSPHGEVDSLALHSDVSNGIQLIGAPVTLEPNLELLVNQEGMTSERSLDRRKRGRGKHSFSGHGAFGVTNSAALGSRKVNNYVHEAIGRFLYDIGAPPDAANSAYFQPMIDAIASGGSGVEPPTYHDLRSWILKNSVDEVRNNTDKYRAMWGRTGCSVLVDQWNTESGKVLLSFLVYCPEGTVFLESVDASDIINSSDALYGLLRRVVEDVGVKDVLQVITSNEEQYMVAGRRLTDTFPTLYWTPCAARCLDLILEDFGSIEWINAVIKQARSLTKFVYNHSVVLNMVRRSTVGNDIVEPGVTRYATNFTTLKRLVDLKHCLQVLVTSQEWMDSPYSKEPEGLEMLDLISNQSFWSSCVLIVRLTNPLLRVLRMVGSEKRPAMGYIYAGMYRAKETIKKELVKREEYMVYWNIIDQRWEQQCHFPLHAAGFYLNPKIFYSIEGDMHNDILSGMFDCIERLVPDTKIQDKIIKELNLYKSAAGDFRRKMAIRARDTLLPAEWWSTYGGGCPNLARLAIRILSQTCCSIGCRQNQIPFEKVHNIRNSLERQRLSDLVFVQYNLRLRQMVGKNTEQDFMDPISFDSISIIEDWVSGKDMCLEDQGSSDWMTLDSPSASTMLLGPSNDDAEELGSGFYDYEIFGRGKDSEEENVEDNVENH
ncbi:uncharacterized protein LOC109947680 [Prunus persica]|uniref:uncharacterized protein LOC109947680 n=1 Tax=Prunus persica TaxID=3760 RepID=UPI0009ABA630|nr:uncharacterized protein LOC109947680 [Prunus persica]